MYQLQGLNLSEIDHNLVLGTNGVSGSAPGPSEEMGTKNRYYAKYSQFISPLKDTQKKYKFLAKQDLSRHRHKS